MRSLFFGILFFIFSSSVQADNISCQQVFSKVQLTSEKIKAITVDTQDHILSLIGAISKVDVSVLLKNKSVKPDQIFDLGEKGTLPEEKLLLLKLALLVEANQLSSVITKAFDGAVQKASEIPQLSGLKNISVQKKNFIISTLVSTITSTVQLRGLTTQTKHVQYVEWQERREKIKVELDNSPKGLKNILYFAKSKWGSAKEIRVLVDGEASFARRDELMKNAQESIEILTWSLYDDMTGYQAVDLLIAQKNKNKKIKIRVVVDGQIAENEGHRDAVKRLEDNGIEVIRWRSASNPYEGQHRKMIIVDGEHVIAGGLNFGDVYSHKNPDPEVARWRDTDIYARGGSFAINAKKLFAEIWNQQIDSGIVNFKKIKQSEFVSHDFQESGYKVALINHDPSTNPNGSTILMTLLKGIRESKKIKIENAYVILFPELRAELDAAVQRGAKVSIFTNSSESVDEPIVSIPILRSVKQLAEMGAQVFLKKGATLHSKFVIFDDQYVMIMSYNLHPRSERMEGEMGVLVDSNSFAAEMHQVFNADTQPSRAVLISDPEQIQLQDSFSVLATLRIFFDPT